MRKIHLLGLALFAMFAFSAVATATASAAEVPQWLIDGNPILLGERIHAEILAEGEKLSLEDMNAFGKPEILCEPEAAGSLGWLLPEGEDEQETGKCPNAVDDKSVCTTVTVEPVHLPWLTLLLEPTTGEFVDHIESGTGGNPGWLVHCIPFIGEPVTDECTKVGSLLLLTNETDGLVHAEFMNLPEAEKAEWADCSVGGKEQGLVIGLFWIHALSGETGGEELLTLAVSLAPEVV